jgi:putative addiction module killer protein
VETGPRKVQSYQDGDVVPFDDWLQSLKDRKGTGQIEARINKIRRGLLGDYDDVGEGIMKLKLDNVGPGYRIYCADNGTDSLLLCGGTKKTQGADILRAKKLWKDFKNRDV